MRVLGIHDGHNASVCLIDEGTIRFAIQEERLNRIKNYDGFPYLAFKETLTACNISLDNINCFALASNHLPKHKTKDELLEMYGKSGLFSTKLKYLLKKTPIKAMHRRKRKIERINETAKAGIPRNKIKFVEHHTCHAYAGIWGSHFRKENILVFTNDGAGDDLCATVSIFNREGKFERIQEILAGESIGYLYGLITFILGMVPLEHEYKLMGIAPYAPDYGLVKSYNALKDIYESIGENGIFKRKSGFPHMFTALKKVENLIKFHRFDWISAGIQKLTEDILVTWTKFWIKETGIKKIVLSGGVFLNVKANKLIMELPDVDDLFIFPSCGDETNSIGAAFYVYQSEKIKMDKDVDIQTLKDVYLGGEFNDREIENTLKNYIFKDKIDITYYNDIEKETASLLTKGEIVARIKGRMEFGARALGNRSILANPQNWDTVYRINKIVKKRDFWMPFAPTILGDKAGDYFFKSKPVNAPYMILAFDSNKEKRDKMQAAIHPYDATVRPQEIYEGVNPDYYRLVKYFEEFSGESAILNTSFNLHGHPIVYTPEDAIFVLENSSLKYLALGNFMVTRL